MIRAGITTSYTANPDSAQSHAQLNVFFVFIDFRCHRSAAQIVPQPTGVRAWSFFHYTKIHIQLVIYWRIGNKKRNKINSFKCFNVIAQFESPQWSMRTAFVVHCTSKSNTYYTRTRRRGKWRLALHTTSIRRDYGSAFAWTITGNANFMAAVFKW